jgi:hypothetical protein
MCKKGIKRLELQKRKGLVSVLRVWENLPLTLLLSDEPKTGGMILIGDDSLAKSGMHTSRKFADSTVPSRTTSWPVHDRPLLKRRNLLCEASYAELSPSFSIAPTHTDVE